MIRRWWWSLVLAVGVVVVAGGNWGGWLKGGGELKPRTLQELLELSASELERVDIGRMNLICAREVGGERDVFVSGLLNQRMGTCSSFPVLLVALGRRLGYPLYLKLTQGHMFCCWDDGLERFNLEMNGDAVDTPSDEYYLKEPCFGMMARSAREMTAERLMVKLMNAEALSVFLETAGCCAEANGDLARALKFYRAAMKYRPESVILRRLEGRHSANGENI